VLRHGPRRGQHVLQVGRSVFVRRGAHGNHLHQPVRDGPGHVGGELQAARPGVARHDVGQARLVDGNVPFAQGRDPGGVRVHADDVVAHLGQAGAGHQAYIAGANDGDLHVLTAQVRR
jgi:hypothetical protein